MGVEHITSPNARVMPVLLRVAWPVMVTVSITTVSGAATHAWVGHLLGVAGLTVMSLMQWIDLLALWVLSVIPRGASVLISREVGAKTGGGKNVIASAVVLQLALAIAMIAVPALILGDVVQLLVGKLEVADAMRGYLWPWLLSLLPTAVSTLLWSAIGATGHTAIGLSFSAMSLLVFAGTMPLFIRGFGIAGPPTAGFALGVAGCAVALFIITRWSNRLGLGELDRTRPKVDWRRWRSFVAIGGPAQACRIATMLAIGFFVNLAARHDGTDAAAVGIVLRIMFLGANLTFALAIATGIMVAQNFGAKQKTRLLDSVRGALVIALVIGVVLFLLATWARPLATVFTDDDTVADRVMDALRIVRWVFLVIGIWQVLLASFEALGPPVVPALGLMAADAIGVAAAIAIGASIEAAAWGLLIANLIKAALLVALVPYSLVRRVRQLD